MTRADSAGSAAEGGGMAKAHETHGGDIGRRVAQRRGELGLSRDEVAELAAMDPGYVAYLEEHPARFSRGSLYRLAQALSTTSEHLLGADTDAPPGSATTAIPAPRIRTLSAEQCRKLISPGGVGRAAFTETDGTAPVVLPVNYALSDGAVVFRTAAGGIVARCVPGPMSFQVDRIDDAMSRGWSVLATGRARLVDDESERAALSEHHPVRPWAGGEREAWIRLTPEQLTGRRVGRSAARR